jgi:outer membrane protein assembly factor BamB
MAGTNRWIGVMLGFVVLIGATRVVAQDWPQWRGPNRDGKVTGFAVPQTWPEALTQKRRTSVGSGDATPALVGDKLYVFARQGEDEVTICLNASDRKQVWWDKYAAQAVRPRARAAANPAFVRS